MKSEFIHPFVESLVNVLEEATGTPVKRGVVTLKSSPVLTQGTASIVGITGQAEGRVVLDISRETACRLAAKLNGEDIESFDGLAASTINEIANIICGRAVSALVNKGYRLEINPPTLFRGEGMNITTADMDTVVIPVETAFGLINLNIAVRERPARPGDA